MLPNVTTLDGDQIAILPVTQKQSWVSLNVSPVTHDTTIRLLAGGVSTLTGQLQQLTMIRAGGTTIQFDSPAAARDWLEHCLTLLTDALAVEQVPA